MPALQGLPQAPLWGARTSSIGSEGVRHYHKEAQSSYAEQKPNSVHLRNNTRYEVYQFSFSSISIVQAPPKLAAGA